MPHMAYAGAGGAGPQHLPPPGTLRIPGESVNFPYRILNPGAYMICIGGVAESETSDACTVCLEPRCTRRKEGAQKRCATEGGCVPKTEGDASPRGEKIGLQCWAKRTGKTPCDDPRAPPRGMHPGGRSRGRPGGTRGAPGGHPRPRSPPGSKIGLQCSERGRSGSLRP
jgi:hypothetical protein